MDEAAADSGEVRTGRPSLAVSSRCATLSASERQTAATAISFGPFTLYPYARVLERDGARIALGSRALDILIVLTEHAGEVVGHKELIRRVWRGLVVTPSSLRVHVAGLRRVLREGAGSSEYIANVPSQGYCFVAPISQPEIKKISRAAQEPQEPPTPQMDPSLQPVIRKASVADVIQTAAGLRFSSEKRSRSRQVTSLVKCDDDAQLLNLLLATERLLTLSGILELAKRGWRCK